MRALPALALLFLAACGPQIGDLAKGESGRVVRAFNGDALELDNGLVVFLAEIDAPARDQPYAAQAQAEFEALALHREVQLAYGGARRWVGRPRAGEEAAPEAAIAHVFVKSEGGGWFWLQHELVSRGAAFTRPRRENFARAKELATLEAQARAGQRGLWRQRAYRPLNARSASAAAREAGGACTRGAAPYRIVEGRVSEGRAFSNRAALTLEAAMRPRPSPSLCLAKIIRLGAGHRWLHSQARACAHAGRLGCSAMRRSFASITLASLRFWPISPHSPPPLDRPRGP